MKKMRRRFGRPGSRAVLLAAFVAVLGFDTPPRAEANPVYLEEIMTDDEIRMEFLVSARQKKVAPKPHIREADHFQLPLTRDSLPVRPTQRLAALVPDDLYGFFDLYLYVNKAQRGLWAQQMFIYEKRKDRQFGLEARLLISTGREKFERYFTTTPTGLYRLDPTRFFPSAVSRRWDGTAMPWAMMFDYRYRTRMSGLALHAATPNYEFELGSRASGGCVRLYIRHAETLFKRIKGRYAGPVPEFPFDQERGHTKRDGSVMRDKTGEIIVKDGYRVLVIIDDMVMRPDED